MLELKQAERSTLVDEAAISLLESVLHAVHQRRTASFGGVGLICYRSADTLPVTPLRPRQPAELPVAGFHRIVERLLWYSRADNPFHDGFHLLSSDGELTHLSMYFSPPIVAELAAVIPDHLHGGRYRAAQYGSCLPNVIACGAAGIGYSPVIFVSGWAVR